MTTKKLCLYHANCTDGFTAAWAVWKFFGYHAEYVPVSYQQPPPDVTGRDVIIVDFSYKSDVLMDMVGRADRVIVIDHHKTAADDLAGLDRYSTWEAWDNPASMSGALFDMDRSGARLAWDFFHSRHAPPQLVRYVEDRDLWRFRLPQSREINAYISSHTKLMSVWDDLRHDLESTLAPATSAGAAIIRARDHDTDSLILSALGMARIGGADVPCINAPPMWASDIGDKLLKTAKDKVPFVATYYDGPAGRAFSLRSRDAVYAGADVSEVAKAYGGGGHRNAAGFLVRWGDDRMPTML